MTSRQRIDRLDMIIDDCEQDASKLDGMQFNGKTLGMVCGQMLAMISALAHIIKDQEQCHHDIIR